MTKKKIAVVLTQLTAGGAERQTVELLKLLKGTSWEPALVVSLSEENQPYGPVVEELGYALHVIPRKGSFDPVRLWSLRRLMARERVDLVHAVHLLASAYCWLALTGTGRQMLPSVRSEIRDSNPLRLWVYRRMVTDSPVTLVNSHQGLASIQTRLGIRQQDSFSIVPNGLDFRRLPEPSPSTKANLGIDSETPVMSYVGKRAPVKNLPLLFGAIRRLVESGTKFCAVVIGPGLDEGLEPALLEGIPAERIRLLGYRSDVLELVAGSDVLVLTSHSEGCPNVVLEALALGTPVVSTPVGDVSRMIYDGSDGRISEPDVEKFSRTIQPFLLQPRRVCERNRQELCKRFGVEAMVKKTVELWKQILERQGGE